MVLDEKSPLTEHGIQRIHISKIALFIFIVSPRWGSLYYRAPNSALRFYNKSFYRESKYNWTRKFNWEAPDDPAPYSTTSHL